MYEDVFEAGPLTENGSEAGFEAGASLVEDGFEPWTSTEQPQTEDGFEAEALALAEDEPGLLKEDGF